MTIQIIDPISGDVVRDLEGSNRAGLNRIQWNLRSNPEDPDDDDEGPEVWPGIFRVTLRAGGVEQSALIEVLEDVWLPEVR